MRNYYTNNRGGLGARAGGPRRREITGLSDLHRLAGNAAYSSSYRDSVATLGEATAVYRLSRCHVPCLLPRCHLWIAPRLLGPPAEDDNCDGTAKLKLYLSIMAVI